MTVYTHEILILDGKNISMAFCPPLPDSDPLIKKNPFYYFSYDGCCRGYFGTWEIKENKLYLNKINSKNYKLLGNYPAFANWFTGTIKITLGELIQSIQLGFCSVFAKDILSSELHIKIEKGIVNKSLIIDNSNKKIDKLKLGVENLHSHFNKINEKKSIYDSVTTGDDLTHYYNIKKEEKPDKYDLLDTAYKYDNLINNDSDVEIFKEDIPNKYPSIKIERLHEINPRLDLKVSKEGYGKIFINRKNKVFFIKCKESDKSYIMVFVKESSNSYIQIGALSNCEAKKIIGRTADDLISDKTIPELSKGFRGKFAGRENLEGNASVLATGKLQFARPLTYIYIKTAKKSKGFIQRIRSSFENLFVNQYNFKFYEDCIRIYTWDDISHIAYDRYRPIQVGVPYYFIKMFDPKGMRIFHVELLPRPMNRNLDTDIIIPIELFINTAKEIEYILKEHGLKLGDKKFNRLIKLFKNDFQVCKDGKSIINKSSKYVKYSDAKKIILNITKKEFNAVSIIVSPMIRLYYGIGNQTLIISEKEFNNKYSESNGFRTVYVKNEEWLVKDDIYYKLCGNKVSIRQVSEEYNKTPKLVKYIDSESGSENCFVKTKGLQAGKGKAQVAINKLSINNINPSGTNIRVRKAFGIFIYETGESLLDSDMNHSNFYYELKNLNDNGIEYEDSMPIKKLINELLKNNIATKEEINNLLKQKTTPPLTTENLTAALGMDKNGVSSTLRIPLNADCINRLGADLSEENKNELEKYLVTHFDSLIKTTIQVSVDEHIIIDKPVQKKEVPNIIHSEMHRKYLKAIKKQERVKRKR